MPNYSKTEEIFKKEGVIYEKKGDELSEDRWYEQVKNPVTGEFWQLETLKAAGLVSSDFKLPPKFEGKKFPVIEVNAILRVKTSDAKEWLVSRQMHYGIDKFGTIHNKSLDDKESYDMPQFDRREVPIEAGRTERRIVGRSDVKVDDLPFTPENLDELFALVPGEDERSKEGAVSMTIVRKDHSGSTLSSPYSVSRYRDFRNREFDEIYDYSSTPKTRESTSMGKERVTEKHKQYS
jgi:hypothetical protein